MTFILDSENRIDPRSSIENILRNHRDAFYLEELDPLMNDMDLEHRDSYKDRLQAYTAFIRDDILVDLRQVVVDSDSSNLDSQSFQTEIRGLEQLLREIRKHSRVKGGTKSRKTKTRKPRKTTKKRQTRRKK